MEGPAALELRPAVSDDLEALLALEARSVQTCWPEGAYARELGHAHSELWLALAQETPGASLSDRLVGFVSFWVVGSEISLLNIAVDPLCRRQGGGAHLLAHVEEKGRELGGTVVFLEVRAGNRSAVSMYRSRGYLQVGIRKGYYSDNGEDALVLSRELGLESGEDATSTGPEQSRGV